MDGSEGSFQAGSRGPGRVTPQAAPGDGVARAALRPLRTTTRHVARTEQFDFWRSCSRLVDLARPPASGPQGFEAEETTWRIGPMALMTAHVAACAYRRTATQIKRDGLDHWTISVAAGGARRFRTEAGAVVMKPGAAYVTSLAAPYEVERTRSSWIHLFVPRDSLPCQVGSRAGSQPLVLESATGQVLREYMATLAARLPAMRESEVPHLVEATRALVIAALLPATEGGDAMPRHGEGGPADGARIVGLRRLVRENLHAVTFGPHRLCRLSGMSRSQLYRLFAPLGGVAAFIRDERLRAAERMLRDPADGRGIAEIAAAVGLCDPSSFGRMFRIRFGCSPRELREAALAGQRPGLRAQARAPAHLQDVSDILRALS